MAERAAKQLELNKSELPNSIVEVIATLTRAGFDAYIVGGGVRDTLLGLRPKDFDAVTDAKPHEIKDIFGKRCRIIGRRFQLAHVYSGRDLIEVATFRGPPTNDANTNQEGMILRDNVWGDIEQDFSRRDFSINALYYQPLKGVVHDFCGALEDIDNKVIRLLGQASVRIEEDPVRLLRALRFKAKLGFEFDKALTAQFHDRNWALLEQISPHRLYDETQKMFTGGYLVPLLPLLFEYGAIDSLIIYPPTEPSALVRQVAINTDKRIGSGKSINPAFFYAALLWENYLHQLEKAKKRNLPFAEAQVYAASKVIERQRIKTAIPKFAEQFIRDIWTLQPRLAAPRSKQIVQLAEHPRFRAGFDFLLLREQCGDAEYPLSESTNEMGIWWQTYQTLSDKEQQQAVHDFDDAIRRGAHKRSRGRNRQHSNDNESSSAISHVDQNGLNQNTTKQRTNKNANQSDSGHTGATKVNEATNKTYKNTDKQTVTNDASNIPSRRRRATSQSRTAASSPSHKQSDGSMNEAQQIKQDMNELAQLQRLSLTNTHTPSTDQRHPPKPAPLFVIEHEKVVPPLIRQGGQNKPTPTKQASPEVDKVAVQETTTPKQAFKKKGALSTSDTKTSPAKNTTARTVASVPSLVSMNNEPIPHQRRRRQPTIAHPKMPDTGHSDNATTKPTKKASPITAQTPNAHATASPKAKASKAKSHKETDNKAKTNSDVTIHKVNDHKGAVPAKRRRRQVSTDSV